MTTTAMLDRHVAWARQLADAAIANADAAVGFWVLVDETHGGSGCTSARGRLQALAHEAGIADGFLQCFVFTEADMLERFPVVRSLRRAMPGTPDVRDCFSLPHQKSLAWGFHTEAILLWWEHVSSSVRGRPAHVWVLEDDAGYSGDLSEFVQTYAQETADLVVHGIQLVEEDWVWRDTASPHFLQLVPFHRRFRCAEHVQRLSALLLDALQRYCDKGISGWSEMSIPSLCSNCGLEMRALKPEHIGALYVFHGKVPALSWERICTERATRNRWWHALKW